MAAHAGDAVGEAPCRFDLCDVVKSCVAAHGDAKIDVQTDEAVLLGPRRAVTSVVENLIKNALDASPNALSVRVTNTEGAIRLSVEDDGGGMDQETLSRAQEPFFTTKAEGGGMGLGLFLVSSIVERLGGRFELRSKKGEGTRAVVDLPRGGMLE
jgi:signal transduction histidine kinase